VHGSLFDLHHLVVSAMLLRFTDVRMADRLYLMFSATSGTVSSLEPLLWIRAGQATRRAITHETAGARARSVDATPRGAATAAASRGSSAYAVASRRAGSCTDRARRSSRVHRNRNTVTRDHGRHTDLHPTRALRSRDDARSRAHRARAGARRTDSWLSNQKTVLDQLDRHNQGIDDIARAIGRRTTDVKKKILFASQNGYTALDAATKRALTVSIQQKGWTLQLIPDASIEKFDELINRVR
jgi:hypothetical protein